MRRAAVRRAAVRRARRGAATVAWLGAVAWPGAMAWWGAAAAAQQGAPAATRAVASVRPETVRVGEAFLLGVTVRARPAAEVRFPGTLALGEALEQREPPEVRRMDRPGEWRAYYRLLAWEPGVHELPPVRVALSEGTADESFEVTARAVTVLSVLPRAAGDELELRGPRPFLERSHFLWAWLVLAGLVLAALSAWAWRRRRRRGQPAPAPGEEPDRRALRELARLRAGWEAGGLGGAEFFDELEGVLRRYAEETRKWDPGLPLRRLLDGDRALARALELSAWVRFGRLGVAREEPLRAAEACAEWIRGDGGGPTAPPPGPDK